MQNQYYYRYLNLFSHYFRHPFYTIESTCLLVKTEIILYMFYNNRITNSSSGICIFKCFEISRYIGPVHTFLSPLILTPEASPSGSASC